MITYLEQSLEYLYTQVPKIHVCEHRVLLMKFFVLFYCVLKQLTEYGVSGPAGPNAHRPAALIVLKQE